MFLVPSLGGADEDEGDGGWLEVLRSIQTRQRSPEQ